ncbi:MAG: zinc-dependent alcohol dehydrogenase family protein [Bacteroidota bacterium]
MKVGLFEKPGSLRVVNKDLRRLGEGEVLVRVEACGICGTDLHIVDGSSRSTPPVVLGHEYAGIVEDVGPGIKKDGCLGCHVSVDPNISCGRCFFCRRGLVHLCSNLRALGVDLDGGMAEYSIVPEPQIHRLPPGMDGDTGALIEPVSCVVHGIDRARISPGDIVVILGGGTVGLIMLQLVQHAGAAKTLVVEPVPHKRELALRLGATLVMDPASGDVEAWVRANTEVGADLVIECAGRPETMQLSLDLARRGGVVEFFGVCPIGVSIPVEPNLVYAKELTIVGSYVNPHTFTRAAALLQASAVRPNELEIQHFPLDGLHEAFEALRTGSTLKSMIHPGR